MCVAAGEVAELFGCSCFGCHGANSHYNLDEASPAGGARADDNPAYLIDVYMNWRWHADGQAWMLSMWNQTKLAIQFVLMAAPEPYHLPWRMVNTNDEHGAIGDVNTYNAWALLVAMAICEQIAPVAGDAALAQACTSKRLAALASMERLLWVEVPAPSGNGSLSYWRQAWCTPPHESGTALEGGSLYFYVWSRVLGLETGVPVAHVSAHLQAEMARNLGPDGIVFATNRTVDYYLDGCSKTSPQVAVTPQAGATARPKDDFTARLAASVTARSEAGVSPAGSSGQYGGEPFVDNDVWANHAMTHAAAALYVQTELHHSAAADALEAARRVIATYREQMNDFYDWRDTATRYDDNTGAFASDGTLRPSVNSHYTRQTFWFAIVLAMSGQQYDARRGELSFAPHPSLDNDGSVWLVLLPSYHGLVRRIGRKASGTRLCVRVSHVFGRHDTLKELRTLRLDGKVLGSLVDAGNGSSAMACA